MLNPSRFRLARFARGSRAIVLWYCSYLYLELLSGPSRYQRLVACILGYFLLPLNLLYSNSVFSGLRGFPHSHVSVRVLPVGISVSHWHPRDLARQTLIGLVNKVPYSSSYLMSSRLRPSHCSLIIKHALVWPIIPTIVLNLGTLHCAGGSSE